MEEGKLNFYSRYTRAKQVQEIDSLCTLIQDDMERNEGIGVSFTSRQMSEIKTVPNSSVSGTITASLLRNDQKVMRMHRSITPSNRQIQQKSKSPTLTDKMKRLEELEHSFLKRANRSISTPKQIRSKKQVQHSSYINVIQSGSESSSTVKIDDSKNSINMLPQKIDPPELRKKTYQKISTLIEKKHSDNIYAESFDESKDEDKQASSIVIERLKIVSKHHQDDAGNLPATIRNQVKNLYEIELTHSQSELVIKSHRTPEVATPQMESSEEKLMLPPTLSPMEVCKQEPTHNSKMMKISDCEEHKEEILDKVPDIQTANETYAAVRSHSPQYFSQIQVRTFHSAQLEEKPSNALGGKLSESLIDQSPFDVHEEQSQQCYRFSGHDDKPAEKKFSFKKLMLDNKKELNPRLVTSTILNEHLENSHNENANHYGKNSQGELESPDRGQSPKGKSQKINFKKVFIKNSKKDPSFLNANKKAPHIQQTNRLLLRAFFQIN